MNLDNNSDQVQLVDGALRGVGMSRGDGAGAGGLVLETGGMLAHGACLSREYGLPAVQLRNAIQLIVDGALIKVNGDIRAGH